MQKRRYTRMTCTWWQMGARWLLNRPRLNRYKTLLVRLLHRWNKHVWNGLLLLLAGTFIFPEGFQRSVPCSLLYFPFWNISTVQGSSSGYSAFLASLTKRDSQWESSQQPYGAWSNLSGTGFPRASLASCHCWKTRMAHCVFFVCSEVQTPLIN